MGQNQLTAFLINTMFQVRIQRPSAASSAPPAEESEVETDAEPAEQLELLECNTAAEQNQWLWTSKT